MKIKKLSALMLALVMFASTLPVQAMGEQSVKNEESNTVLEENVKEEVQNTNKENTAETNNTNNKVVSEENSQLDALPEAPNENIENSSVSAATYFTVSFNDGDKLLNSQLVAYNGRVKLTSTPSKSGYVFQWWCIDKELTEIFDPELPINKNVTVYAKWRDVNQKFTITFDSLGGTYMPPSTVLYGKGLSKPATEPTKNGYTLAGWTLYKGTNSKFEFESKLPVMQDFTLYAIWVPNTSEEYKFDIYYYNSINENYAYSEKITKGQKIIDILKPEKSGYVFNGWYTDRSLSTLYNFNNPVTSDVYLYAKWTRTSPTTPDSFKITFNTNGGSSVNFINVLKGKTFKIPETPIKYGYTFAGWYLDPNFVEQYYPYLTATKNMTLYAKWTTNKPAAYKMTFETNGGEKMSPLDVASNITPKKPTDPVKLGYKFAGWYLDRAFTSRYTFTTPIKSNVTLYARWTKNNTKTYTVIFNTNGGSIISSATVKADSLVLKPYANPTKMNSRFEGWYTDSSFTREFNFKTTKINSDTTIYAKWSNLSSKYSVKFETSGGTPISETSIIKGNLITKPTEPTKKGYIFDGWYTDSFLKTRFDFTKPPIKNTTLYAKWLKGASSYTVSFNTNGGTTIKPLTVEANKSIARPVTPTKAGYKFMGWYVNPSLPNQYDFSQRVNSDFTLYAKWLKYT